MLSFNKAVFRCSQTWGIQGILYIFLGEGPEYKLKIPRDKLKERTQKWWSCKREKKTKTGAFLWVHVNKQVKLTSWRYYGSRTEWKLCLLH